MSETSKIIKAVAVRARVSLKRRRVLIGAFLRVFADRGGYPAKYLYNKRCQTEYIFQKVRQRDINKKSKWYFAFYEYDFPSLSLFVGSFIKESSTIRAGMSYGTNGVPRSFLPEDDANEPAATAEILHSGHTHPKFEYPRKVDSPRTLDSVGCD